MRIPARKVLFILLQEFQGIRSQDVYQKSQKICSTNSSKYMQKEVAYFEVGVVWTFWCEHLYGV